MAELYSLHADALIRFATGLVGPSDAQDVVADAMARLMVAPVWEQAVNPRSVMFRAVMYQAHTFLRGRRRRWAREARATRPGVFVMPAIEPEVAAAVQDLSPQQRAVVFLTYWEDLGPVAVADLLGVREGTVRKQLSRARAKLREALDEDVR